MEFKAVSSWRVKPATAGNFVEDLPAILDRIGKDGVLLCEAPLFFSESAAAATCYAKIWRVLWVVNINKQLVIACVLTASTSTSSTDIEVDFATTAYSTG